MDDTEIEVLSLGPKFTPTPKCDIETLNTDVEEFCRKLRLGEYFSNTYKKDDTSIVRNRSTFNPTKNRNEVLDNCIEFMKNYPLNPKEKHKRNVNKNQYETIKKLASDASIVVKQADKGGTFIIMDSKFYEEKMEEMLHETSTYKHLIQQNDDSVMKTIEKFVTKYKNVLTEKEKKYLVDFDNRNSNLYGLPKIHKSDQIKKAIIEQNATYVKVTTPADLTFRPIVAGPQCPTSRLSSLLDELLKPLVTNVKSYIKDTRDFITHLNTITNIEIEDTLVTFDVKSLYTNISHDLGKNAIAYWIEKHRDQIPTRFSLNFILEGLTIVLKNNTFYFNDKYYLQLTGTAMGTKVAPSYANLTLGWLEEKMYEKILNQYGENASNYVKQQYKRFLDDCFMLCKNKVISGVQMEELLNSMDALLTYTKEESSTHLPFLDVLILKNENTIETDIYHKETDSFNYVPYKSNHPRKTKNNIPYTLARRVQMLVSNPNTRQRRFLEMEETLLQKDYPKGVIGDAITKAKGIDRTILLQDKGKDKNDTDDLVFITTFNPSNPDITEMTRTVLTTLKQNTKTENIYKRKKLLFAKRQSPSLKRLLTKASFNNTTRQYEIRKCKSKCITCQHMSNCTEVRFKDSDSPFKLKYNFTCTTKNLIYLMKCQCGEDYIGETKNMLKVRLNTHRQQIRDETQRHLKVSKHIAQCGGIFQIFPFFKMKGESDIERKRTERRFIQKYRPSLNCDP